MDNSRRQFLKNSTLAVAGTALLSGLLFARSKKAEHLGVQLFSVRDAMAKDPAGSLQRLADIGFKDVEHAGYINRKFYGYTPVQFKKLLAGMGLQMISGHTGMWPQDWDTGKNDFTDQWKYTVADAAEVGMHYLVSPALDKSLQDAGNRDGLKKFMQQFNKCGELCKAHGIKFAYHNYNYEFGKEANGDTIYDFILANTDPALVAMQMDIGNMRTAGGMALELLKKYPGRFELMHVKDELQVGQGQGTNGYDSTIIGQGLIPVHEIVKTARATGGTSVFIIEQEAYQDKDPFACVQADLGIMKSWGF